MGNWPQHIYFQRIIEGMKIGGYRFYSWISMDSRQVRYRDHLPGRHKHSRLYFTREGCALIVMFEYSQHKGGVVDGLFDKGYFASGWRVEIWYQYSRENYLETLKLYRDIEDGHPGFDFTEHYTSHARLGSSIFTYAGSNHGNHCMFEQTTRSFSPDVILNPVYVYTPALLLLADIGRFLHERFYTLNLLELAPIDAFPGCKDLFFARFPEDVSKLVEHAWG